MKLVFIDDVFREVEPGGGASEVVDGGVVGTRRRHGGGVGAEPNTGALVGFPDLRYPLPPLSHPYPSVGLLFLVMLLFLLLSSLALLWCACNTTCWARACA